MQIIPNLESERFPQATQPEPSSSHYWQNRNSCLDLRGKLPIRRNCELQDETIILRRDHQSQKGRASCGIQDGPIAGTRWPDGNSRTRNIRKQSDELFQEFSPHGFAKWSSHCAGIRDPHSVPTQADTPSSLRAPQTQLALGSSALYQLPGHQIAKGMSDTTPTARTSQPSR